ncbi:hypothetical protein TNIN_212661 [Trichonephila inaurata madagascariensis]|uniref:Uncharacterized protein n=1 Tax=Trichonephila inaurata madagascariensis TaxID=2747483 RepID=A0A8X6WU34_9ARAC|nr:hypothetical protein TNIN_212661 [Trichonephila inaurata madagascariensis]
MRGGRMKRDAISGSERGQFSTLVSMSDKGSLVSFDYIYVPGMQFDLRWITISRIRLKCFPSQHTYPDCVRSQGSG